MMLLSRRSYLAIGWLPDRDYGIWRKGSIGSVKPGIPFERYPV